MGRPKSTHCLRGHEIARVGRYVNGRCRACVMGKDDPPIYEPGLRGRKPMTVCSHGHRLAEVGRYVYRGRSKGCLACHRERGARHYRRTKPDAKKREPRQRAVVPFGPLDELLQRREGSDRQVADAMVREGGNAVSHLRSIHRARSAGVMTPDLADRICVAMGRHPVEVYGSAWWDYSEEVARAV